MTQTEQTDCSVVVHERSKDGIELINLANSTGCVLPSKCVHVTQTEQTDCSVDVHWNDIVSARKMASN